MIEKTDYSDRQCYTYLIGWKERDVWYYGSKYGKGCHPDTFWVKYHTSSHVVPQCRTEWGEPDVIEVRQLHASPLAARRWEHKVIRRMNAVKSGRWLNNDPGHPDFANVRGFKRDALCRERIGRKQKEYHENMSDARRVIYLEERQKSSQKAAPSISARAKERFADPDWKENVHNASHRTDEYRAKMSENSRRTMSNPIHKAKYMDAMASPEYKAKMSIASIRINADPAMRRRKSETLKKTLSTPEARRKKSEAASASTAKRLESRERNKMARAARLI